MTRVAMTPEPPARWTMIWIRGLNLIHLFDFYLAIVFLASTVLRLRQYEAIVRLVRAVPGRWPKLLRLVRQHHAIFLTFSTMLPALLALGLSIIHLLASRLLWPQANLTVGQLVHLRLALVILFATGLAMVSVDAYATFVIGEVNRSELETYFDQAEYWLVSWAAPVVRFFTFGYVNPRKMVAVEVRKALEEASRSLNSTLWWLTAQVGLRILFGLCLWLTWGLAI